MNGMYKDFMIAYIMTTTFNGKRYDARKASPYDKLKKDLLWLAKQDGRKVKFTLEADTSDDKAYMKALVKNAPQDVSKFLNPSHIDIYRANPVGQAFRERVGIASKAYREVLKQRWLTYPSKSKQSRDDAKSSFGAYKSSNQFIQGMITALASMK